MFATKRYVDDAVSGMYPEIDEIHESVHAIVSSANADRAAFATHLNSSIVADLSRGARIRVLSGEVKFLLETVAELYAIVDSLEARVPAHVPAKKAAAPKPSAAQSDAQDAHPKPTTRKR